jgi:flagellar hook-length control protein FliK
MLGDAAMPDTSATTADILPGDATAENTTPPNTGLFSILGQGTTAGVTTQNLSLGGDAEVVLTGEPSAIEAFAQQVEDTLNNLMTKANIVPQDLGDSKEFVAALMKMGMSQQDAVGTATRIDTMLKMVKANAKAEGKDISDETLGEVAAVMLAALMPQTPTANTSSAEGASENTSFQITVDVQNTDAGNPTVNVALQAFQQSAARGGNVARQMAGLEGQAATSFRESQALNAGAVPETEPQVQVAVKVGGTEGGSVAVTLSTPQTEHTDAAAPTDQKSDVAAESMAVGYSQAAAVQAAHVQSPQGILGPTRETEGIRKVGKHDEIAKPEGQTVYRWTSENGTETLEAVAPTAAKAATDAASAQQTAAAQMATMLASGGATDMATQDASGNQAASFSERMAAAQHVQAARQVEIQMKPLLDQGGGSLRMTLHPEELGQVTVDLQITDGKVRGTIAASQPAVVEQLARELHTLKQGLSDSGLQLGEQGIALMVSSSNTQDQNGQGQGASQQEDLAMNSRVKGWRGSDESGVEAAAEISPALWIAPDRVVDVRI